MSTSHRRNYNHSKINLNKLHGVHLAIEDSDLQESVFCDISKNHYHTSIPSSKDFLIVTKRRIQFEIEVIILN